MVTQTSPMLPFKGLRVVDMTQGLAGPFCAMLLGHYGATVIKVEPPEGDWSRTLGATKGDRTPAYTTCNRGKQALVVDLKQKAGLEVVLKLAEDCDVFLESNRQGVADRLGIGYEAIRAVSPDVVYGSVTGFGQSGAYASRPATDAILQAFTGLMSRNRGADGQPRRIGYAVPDYTTGLMAYQSVSTALYAKAVGQGGRHLDISLMRSMLFYQQHGLVQEAVRTRILARTSGAIAIAARPVRSKPPMGPINISIVREKFFQSLCAVLDLPEVASDPRFTTLATRRDHEEVLRGGAGRCHHIPLDGMSCARPSQRRTCLMRRSMIMRASFRIANVQETGTLAWLEDAALGSVPIVNLPGTAPLAAGDPRGNCATSG